MKHCKVPKVLTQHPKEKILQIPIRSSSRGPNPAKPKHPKDTLPYTTGDTLELPRSTQTCSVGKKAHRQKTRQMFCILSKSFVNVQIVWVQHSIGIVLTVWWLSFYPETACCLILAFQCTKKEKNISFMCVSHDVLTARCCFCPHSVSSCICACISQLCTGRLLSHRNACLLRVQQQHRRRQKLRKKSPSGVNPFWGRRKRTQLKSCRCNLKLTACDKLQSQLRTNWDPSVIASFYSNTNSVRQNETFAFGKLLTVGSNGLEVIHWACWRGYIWDRH